MLASAATALNALASWFPSLASSQPSSQPAADSVAQTSVPPKAPDQKPHKPTPMPTPTPPAVMSKPKTKRVALNDVPPSRLLALAELLDRWSYWDRMYQQMGKAPPGEPRPDKAAVLKALGDPNVGKAELEQLQRKHLELLAKAAGMKWSISKPALVEHLLAPDQHQKPAKHQRYGNPGNRKRGQKRSVPMLPLQPGESGYFTGVQLFYAPQTKCMATTRDPRPFWKHGSQAVVVYARKDPSTNEWAKVPEDESAITTTTTTTTTGAGASKRVRVE